VQTLLTLVRDKRVEYDFSFYTLPINAEVAVTVLSEGKPLLSDSLDVILPLNPTSPLRKSHFHPPSLLISSPAESLPTGTLKGNHAENGCLLLAAWCGVFCVHDTVPSGRWSC